jgi:uncharacterized protein (TIGR02145 family)
MGSMANFWTTSWDDLNGFGYYSLFFRGESNYFNAQIEATDPYEAVSVRCVKDEN